MVKTKAKKPAGTHRASVVPTGEARRVRAVLRRTIKGFALSENEVGRRCSWSIGYMSRVLNGVYGLQVGHLEAICGGLEIPLDFLYLLLAERWEPDEGGKPKEGPAQEPPGGKEPPMTPAARDKAYKDFLRRVKDAKEKTVEEKR